MGRALSQSLVVAVQASPLRRRIMAPAIAHPKSPYSPILDLSFYPLLRAPLAGKLRFVFARSEVAPKKVGIIKVFRKPVRPSEAGSTFIDPSIFFPSPKDRRSFLGASHEQRGMACLPYPQTAHSRCGMICAGQARLDRRWAPHGCNGRPFMGTAGVLESSNASFGPLR